MATILKNHVTGDQYREKAEFRTRQYHGIRSADSSPPDRCRMPDEPKGGSMKTFADRAYDLLRTVPAGRVTTYKELAHGLGTKAYRGIGQAMKRNPYAPEVP